MYNVFTIEKYYQMLTMGIAKQYYMENDKFIFINQK